MPPSGSRLGRPQLRASCSPAFTLVELVVVIGIVSILAVTVLPIIASMWRDTRGADAANRVNGLIRSARMRALGGRDTGLFFFVESGTQKVVFIQAEPPDYNDPAYIDASTGQNNSPDLGQNFVRGDGNDVFDQYAADRFRVLKGNIFQLPPPFRVAPLTVLDDAVWNDEERANQEYDDANVIFSGTNGGPQNHRNFFTVIFSPEGNLTIRDTVLIHDPAPPPADPFATGINGKVTLLPVGAATRFEDETGGTGNGFDAAALPGMIFAEDNGIVALNFPSVDGLLVYDDSSFGQFPDDDDTDPANIVDKRDFLAQTGQPLYISWQTGAIVRGPTGP